MNKEYLFFAIGNALLDIIIKTNDYNIDKLGLVKGTMKLITKEELSQMDSFIKSRKNKAFIPAGSAGNTAKISALLGQRTIFFGTVGDDENGITYTKGMSDLGITTLLRKNCQYPTGICLSLITDDGERTMLTCLGAAGELDQSIIDFDIIQKTRYIYIEGYQFTHKQGIKTIRSILDTCKESGMDIKIAFDLSDPFVAIQFRDDILGIIDKIDILFANEKEAAAFSGLDNPEKALSCLNTMVDLPVIKLGERGSMSIREGGMIYQPTRPVKPVDTTGAGDSYSAGFLTALSKGFKLEDCLCIGNLVAKEMVKIYGTELGSDNLKEITEEYGL